MSDHIEYGPDGSCLFACGQPLTGAWEASTLLRVVEDPLAAAEAGADRLECVIQYTRGARYLPSDGGDGDE